MGLPSLRFERPAAPLTGIYAIVDPAFAPNPAALLDDVLAAGVRIVQYRAKAGVDGGLLRRLLARTRAAGAALVVNDDVESALAADGLHAGQEDLAGVDLASLRARLGDRLFGVSCGTAAEARAAEAAGADYVGTGPFAATSSKADAGVLLGPAGLAAVVAATRLPVAAIGGIDLAALPAVARAGAAMAAVISAIALAPDPRAAARALVERWETVRT